MLHGVFAYWISRIQPTCITMTINMYYTMTLTLVLFVYMSYILIDRVFYIRSENFHMITWHNNFRDTSYMYEILFL